MRLVALLGACVTTHGKQQDRTGQDRTGQVCVWVCVYVLVGMCVYACTVEPLNVDTMKSGHLFYTGHFGPTLKSGHLSNQDTFYRSQWCPHFAVPLYIIKIMHGRKQG